MPVATEPRCARCGATLPSAWRLPSCPQCLVHFSIDAVESAGAIPASTAAALADFELLAEIARGGMGVVYRARHRRLDRIVAVKVLAAAPFASPETRQRFRVEAEAAARLQHPGIVAIHDVGETDGLPWLAMDFVAGENLAAVVREQPLPARQAAGFVRAIAEAVQHAHQHGVLHRDLKPSNILLDPEAGPRVTDFGIARCGSGTELTRTGEVLGSPGYTAPEQALGGTADARTDVYGLGALLYHLLTARPPFQAPTLDAIVLQLREMEPLSPRRLNPAVPRDLETICLHCLRKDPSRRYGTAREIAEDLARFLADEPILARPIGTVGRVGRWARRKPWIAALLAMLVVVVGTAFGFIEAARRSEHDAREKLSAAHARLADSLDRTELDRAEDLVRVGDTSEALTLLARVVQRNPAHPVAAPQLASALWHGDLALPLPPPTHAGGKVMAMQFLRDGHTLFVGTDRGIATWDPAAGWRQLVFEPADGSLLGVRLSPDERTFAAWRGEPAGALFLFDAATGRRLAPPIFLPREQHPLAFSSDSTRVIAINRVHPLRVLDARTGEPVGPALDHPALPWAVAFSPDGGTLVTSAGDALYWWDARTHRFLRRSGPMPATIGHVLFSRDGEQILVACMNGWMRWFSAADDIPAGLPMHHEREIRATGLTRDGRRLLTGSVDHTARVWSVPDGQELIPPLRHRDAVNFASFSPDDRHVVTCSRDNTSRVWNAATGRAVSQSLRHFEQPHVAAFAPDGAKLYVSGADGIVQTWDLRRLAVPRALAVEPPLAAASGERLSADGRLKLVFAEGASAAVLSDRKTGQPIGTPLTHADRIADAAFSHDSAFVATASHANEARVWETATSRPAGPPLRHARSVSAVAFSPDGARVATASWDCTAQVWDVRTGRALLREMRHDDHVTGVCFSPDGRRLATVSADKTARVWDAASGQPLTEPLRHDAALTGVRFHADGQRLETLSDAPAARVWDVPEFRGEPPAWLAQVALALAGSMEAFSDVRHRALAAPGAGGYAALVRRLFPVDGDER